MGNKVEVYSRKGELVGMVRCENSKLYQKLDEYGNPTGAIVNLHEALACRAYFTTPFRAKSKEENCESF